VYSEDYKIKMIKTYKDFGEALDELRANEELSYEQFSIMLNEKVKPRKNITTSNIYAIINRRNASAPSNTLIEYFAEFFGIMPEYFYEYRLRKMLELVDKNREYLDYCQKEFNKWSKKERQKTENKSEQDKSA